MRIIAAFLAGFLIAGTVAVATAGDADPSFHAVAIGESYASIAASHGVSEQALRDANGNETLRPNGRNGRHLFIPAPQVVAPTTTRATTTTAAVTTVAPTTAAPTTAAPTTAAPMTAASTTAAVTTTSAPSQTVHRVGPGQSISAAVAAAAPGDLVLVRAGTYPLQIVTSKKSGVVTVRGESRTGVHVAGFVLSGATNVTLQDLSIDGTIIGSSGKGAVWIKDTSFNIIIERVTIDPVSGSGTDSTAGVVVSTRSHHVTVMDSVITGARARGGNGRNVLLYGGVQPQSSGEWVHHIVLAGNDLSGALSDNVQITGGYDVTVTRNAFRGAQVNTDHNDAVQSVSSDNVSITRNTITDSDGSYDEAIQLQSGIVAGACAVPLKTTRAFVANNLIHHVGGTGINLAGALDSSIVNNAVFDNGDGVENGVAKQKFALVLYGGAKDTIGCGVTLPQNVNLRVWNNMLESIYRHPTDTGTSYQTSNVIGGGSNAMPGDVVSNPLFVDRVTYELQANSPAVDLGATVGGTPTEDLDGDARGVAPDAGARELQPGTAPVPAEAATAGADVSATTLAPGQVGGVTGEVDGSGESPLPPTGFGSGVITGMAATLLAAGGILVLLARWRRRNDAIT